MVPAAPPGVNLDPKKSSYKKLSKFLCQKEKAGIIKVKELTKGQSLCLESSSTLYVTCACLSVCASSCSRIKLKEGSGAICNSIHGVRTLCRLSIRSLKISQQHRKYKQRQVTTKDQKFASRQKRSLQLWPGSFCVRDTLYQE